MRKKIGLCMMLMFLFIQSGHCIVLDLILDGAKWFGDQADKISDEVFRNTMMANTIQSVATAKKYYDETTTIYRELKQIQENPGGLGEEIKNDFLGGINDPVNRFWNEVNQQAGRQATMFDTHIATNNVYVKNNRDFEDKIVEWVKKTDNRTKNIVDKLGSNDKTKVDQGKTELNLMQLESQQQQTALLYEILVSQNKQYEDQLITRQRIAERNKMYTESAMRMVNQRREQFTGTKLEERKKKVKQLLGE